jgi:hypothetical protein
MSQPFWWGDWRPNLTPHTGNLQPTDLIECTSISGGVPTNTAITGAQIIAAASGGSATWGGITGTLSSQTDLQTALNGKQNTLVSGTNIKTVNGNSLVGSGDVSLPSNKIAVGTNVTGTTANTISANALLPANTLQLGKPCMIHLKARGRRVSGASAVIAYGMYRNTSVSLTGATFLGQIQIAAINTLGQLERHLFWDGAGNISVQFAGTLVSDMINNGTYSTSVINPAVDNYFLYTIQCSNAGDTGQIQWGLYIIYA